jgi:hypothetical protein
MASRLPGWRGSSRDTRERVDAYLDFRQALREVLVTSDPKQFKQFLKDSGEDLRDPELGAMGRWSEDALLPLMHRMILADRQLATHHDASKQWLRERHLPLRVKPTGYGWSSEIKTRDRATDPEGRSRPG